ncbi:hypothetical protein QYE76_046360 [Lolium multiflorum]|uniref:CCHC-type domain-containing protein n=1 Tax=Lolium multiflorum TaxID=4521 RepID=A0AAD8TPM2_LOLMU|nr:hypothetical protein QYE76_046360 [Lolium multiflorum]
MAGTNGAPGRGAASAGEYRKNPAVEEEPIEELVGRMKLTEAESTKLFIDDREDEQATPVWALAGKVLVPYPKVFHIQMIADVLRPAWGNPRGLVFRDGGPNLFVAELPVERERDRIWERSPWTVNKHAVVLENFKRSQRPSELRFDRLPIWVRVMNLPFNLHDNWGEKIARGLGEFIKIDTTNKMLVSGKYLRARVSIDVNKPLQRWIAIDSSLRESCDWYDIKYENLPYFCFSCGLLGHSDLACPDPGERDEAGRLPYWPSLRAVDEKRKKTGPNVWGNFSGGVSDGAQETNAPNYDTVGATSSNTQEKVNMNNLAQNMPPLPHGGGRGRGRGGDRGGGRFTRGRGNTHAYRKLDVNAQVVPVEEDRALVVFDPKVSGEKRDERPAKNTQSPAPSPDPKKARVGLEASASSDENMAVTDDQSRQEQ